MDPTALEDANKDEEELMDDFAVATTAATAALTAVYYQTHYHINRQYGDPMTGERWMERILTVHTRLCPEQLGLSAESFGRLESLLRQKGGLCDSKYMSGREQLGIFLYAVTSNQTMRRIAERFQRSTETISRNYHKVMYCFLQPEMYDTYLRSKAKTPPEPGHRYSWLPCYFGNCIGAVDGTHIDVFVPTSEQAPFRTRKQKLSQNVLAVCNWDMHFTDVLSGAEGSRNDSALLVEAMQLGAVKVPKGKYILGDAGFSSSDHCLIPYRSTRYHLREWGAANRRPRNKEELFNHRHSRARNIIERIFGVLKRRFAILNTPRPFKMQAQADVVRALCVLHNIYMTFGKAEAAEDDEEGEGEEDGEATVEEEVSEDERTDYSVPVAERRRAERFRDEIAQAMWDNYEL